MEKTDRVLLLGGPCDWRTTVVVAGQPELLIPLPDERPLLVQAMDEVSALSSIPMIGDLKVARYVRKGPLSSHNDLTMGWIFEYWESR